MAKYYIFNSVFMLINTGLLCYIKFIKYNRSIIGNTGEVPGYLYIILAAALIITVAVNIIELMVLIKKHRLDAVYIIISIALLVIPYLAYRRV